MPKLKKETVLTDKESRKYRGVVFDFHFTIAHFYPSREKVYEKIFNKYGFTNSPKDIARAFSRAWLKYTDKELIEAFSQQIDIPSMENWWLEFHSGVFMTLGIEDKKILELINKDISDLVYKDSSIYRLYPDVLETLSFLKKKKVKIGMITNAHGTIREIINELGITEYFDYITISCEVGLSKPDPKIFEYTFEKMGLHNKDVLFVGDSYHTDVVGSEIAGCAIAIIDRKDKDGKKLNKYLHLNNLTQIKNLI
ncbi:MAG: HAD-IA family hydrolase [Candidatus Paceibacterota bacterium]|jgi:REG-2-like HAD superfamily hydrolase